MQVEVAELRRHLADYLEHASKGHDVIVNRRGRPVARITATAEARRRAKRTIEALRGRMRIGDVISPTGATWSADARS